MKTYIKDLHKKPLHHKKRFALLVSGIFTLTIFTFWSLATFSALSRTQVVATEKPADNGPGPLTYLGSNVASTYESFRNEWSKLTEIVNSVDLEAEYEEMREKALETYGQR